MKAILITAGILLLIYISYRVYGYYTLDKGLDQKIDRGAVVLDVRTAEEYASGHIAGSVNISVGTLRQKYTELDTGKTYITVCSHGLRSVKAAAILKERGFKQVYNGGAWSDLQEKIKPAAKGN